LLKTDFFWTDRDQASERLSNTFILYEDKPVFIHEIRSNRGEPKAVLTVYPEGKGREIQLSDKGFGRFRTPLPIGWVNNLASRRACYLQRRPVRSRQHGFSRSNISTMTFLGHDMDFGASSDYSFETIAKDAQYAAAVKGEFPSIDEVLNKIKVKTAVAICPEMAIKREANGIRWLYFNADKVGLFVDSDTLLLTSEYTYAKEQIMETPAFKISTIKEF